MLGLWHPLWTQNINCLICSLRVTLDSICLSGLTPSDLVVLTRDTRVLVFPHAQNVHTQPGVEFSGHHNLTSCQERLFSSVHVLGWSWAFACVYLCKQWPVRRSDSGDNRLPIYLQGWTSQDAHFIKTIKHFCIGYSVTCGWMHARVCVCALNNRIWAYECQCMLITPKIPRGLIKSQLMNCLEQDRLFAG